MAEMSSLSSFGYDFQTKIFKCIIQDKTYGSSILQMLKLSYFSQDKFKLLLDKVKKYHIEYQAIPNYSTVKVMIGGIEQKESAVQVLQLLTKIQQDVVADELQFVKKQSLAFCKNQQMRQAIIDSVDLLQDNNMQGIWDRMNKVLKITLDGDMGLDMNVNFDYVMLKQNRMTVSTGYELLDREFDGGLGKGQLGVVMAPTGAGKSQFLINLAKGALNQGKVVVYVTLQLSQKLVAARMAALLSNTKINSIQDKKEQVVKAIKYFYEKTNSKFIIKQYPTKSIGISSLKSYLHKLRANGVNPNMLIVDYADLLKPPRGTRQKRQQLEQIYESLRQTAGTENLPVWTASQTNRSAIQEQIIGGGAVAESWGKMFVPDAVISISRTTNDKIAGTGKLHIIKNRSGRQGNTFALNVDTSRCFFFLQRMLGSDQLGQDTNKILTNFKSQRQEKVKGKIANELQKFLDKNKRKG